MGAVGELPKPPLPSWQGLGIKAVAHTICLVIVLSVVLANDILPQVMFYLKVSCFDHFDRVAGGHTAQGPSPMLAV